MAKKKEVVGKDKKKKTIIIIISVILVLALIIGVSIFLDYKQKETTYNEAVTLVAKHKYINASEKFKSLDNYKDSKTQLKRTYYLFAKAEIKTKNYEKAIELLKKCKDYKDSKKIIISSYYQYAKEKIKQQNYKEAIKLLENCTSYKDTKDLLIDTKYNYAVSIMMSDKDEAKTIFEQLKDYKDSKKYLDNIDSIASMLGGYVQKNALFNMKIIVNSSSCKYYYIEKYRNEIFSKSHHFTLIDENNFKCGDTTFTRNKTFTENFIADIIETDSSFGLKYTNVSFSKSDDEPPYKPKVGMTKEEVKNSIWGTPNKINKHTYSYSTREQWVYDNNRYIYFENDKVTSISDSE